MCLPFVDFEKAFGTAEFNAVSGAAVEEGIDGNCVKTVKGVNTDYSTDITLFRCSPTSFAYQPRRARHGNPLSSNSSWPISRWCKTQTGLGIINGGRVFRMMWFTLRTMLVK